MPAYVIAELEITDPVTYQHYIEQVPATIAAFGGRYLARGGATEVLDGGPRRDRVVILQFESMKRAREWWTSEEYRGPRALREASARASILLVDGLD